MRHCTSSVEDYELPWLEYSSSMARSDDRVVHFLCVSACSLLEVRICKSLQFQTAAKYENLSMGFRCASQLLDSFL